MPAALLFALLSAAPDHVRIETERGPVHVLFQPHAKLTVIYVHGYYTRVDDAWVQHRLPDQLLASGVPATFIVPEGPAGADEDVVWPDLDALLKEVERATGRELPSRVVAAGHSGGYRTLASWTGSRRVRAFVLLDALYGSVEPWLATPKPLLVVSHSTARRGAMLCRRHAQARCALAAESHMAIVTQGRWLPLLLKQATEVVAEVERRV